MSKREPMMLEGWGLRDIEKNVGLLLDEIK